MKLLTEAKDVKPSDFMKYHPKIEDDVKEKPKKHIAFQDPTIFDYDEDDWSEEQLRRWYEYWD